MLIDLPCSHLFENCIQDIYIYFSLQLLPEKSSRIPPLKLPIAPSGHLEPQFGCTVLSLFVLFPEFLIKI